LKRLVLLGGGHVHVHCLAAFAADAIPGVRVTLVSPYARQVYSGMLPGWIAGRYSIDECVIPLAPLAQRAGAAFHQTRAGVIDPIRRVVRCVDGSEHPYDVLSIDTGPVADLAHLPGAREHALPVRPLEEFIAGWCALRDRLRAAGGGRIVMVGAGAAGVELALAMHESLRDLPLSRFALISATDTLPGRSGARLERLAREAGIEVFAATAAERIVAGGVEVDGGTVIEADAIIVSTGTAAAPWLQRAGLALDERGFVLTDSTLRVVSHPRVFAAGDCASVRGYPRPKSGVFAVRAGPPLAENLRRALAGSVLRNHVPQKRALYLVSAGSGYAVGSWDGFAWEGAWVWRWKDRIDRRFIAKYSVGAEEA
jgi:selenide,water dikinase